MTKGNLGDRSTKIQKAEAEKVLKDLLIKAFNDGELVLDFQDDVQSSKRLFNALTDYRKKIRNKRSEYFTVSHLLDSISLIKKSPTTIILRRKQKATSDRTALILSLKERFPHLNETPNRIDSIVEDFKTSS
jgi:hypothetical protein